MIKFYRIENTATAEIWESPVGDISLNEFWDKVVDYCDNPNALVYRGVVEYEERGEK